MLLSSGCSPEGSIARALLHLTCVFHQLEMGVVAVPPPLYISVPVLLGALSCMPNISRMFSCFFTIPLCKQG